MGVNRQDAWTKEEDMLLAKTVIDYIKKGYTQLESFKDVAEQLNRTPAACGFRWNATIRKNYRLEIDEAKQARKKFQHQDLSDPQSIEEESSIKSVDQAIQWLEKLKIETKNQAMSQNGTQNHIYIEENKRLQEEITNYQTLFKKIKLLINEIDI
ncbi:RsfA family transcriptional regulator [Amphibacillus indicireducens]|uniref:RsfA family transcriptional regulator n=1 Tax=Amphibacillus indicireducens TaxID=1076330 RepID=A0ABP7VBN9_9BACI